MKNNKIFFIIALLNYTIINGCVNNINKERNNFRNSHFNDKNTYKQIDQNSISKYFIIYIDPNGNDQFLGESFEKPIKTIYRAQKILELKKPKSNIIIYFNPGIYFEQQVNWNFTNGKNIYFSGYNQLQKSLFNGNGKELWLRLISQNGKNSNLHFQHLEIINYKLGVGLTGNRDDSKNGWNGNNHFYNVTFRNIGSKYSIDKSAGYSAINLVNSRNNSIINCRFINIENLSKNQEEILMHSIYLSHYSSGNVVKNCTFENNSGDPIRFRDESNKNIILKNKFSNSGYIAICSEWFCNSETTKKKCTKESGECSSYGNKILKNKFTNSYSGTKINISYYFGSNDYCKKSNRKRIITKANEYINEN